MLDSLRISSLENQLFDFFSPDDTPRLYPTPISYQFNSRGFRDQEWPEKFHDVIWCLGDSQTMGIGSSIDRTWPYQLSKITGRTTINISLRAASNNWISRQARLVSETFPNAQIAVLWSFVERRELSVDVIKKNQWSMCYDNIKDISWPECNDPTQFDKLPLEIRQELKNCKLGDTFYIDDNCAEIVWLSSLDEFRQCQIIDEEHNHLKNWIGCLDNLHNDNINHLFTFKFAQSPKKYMDYIHSDKIILPRDLGDRSRDSFHFDLATSVSYAKDCAKNIANG